MLTVEESEKKREIRRIALKMFKEKEYDNVTIQDICKEAGISKNTFYYYFESKEAIVFDLFQNIRSVSSSSLIEIASISDPCDQITFLLSSMANEISELGRNVVKKVLVANLSRPENMRQKPEFPHEVPPMLKLIETIVQRAMDLGEIRDDLEPRSLIWTCSQMFVGCMQVWATAPFEMDLKEMLLKSIQILTCMKKTEE